MSGTTELYAELERELAAFCGTESALVFSSGYTANLAVVTALCGPDTLMVADRHNHASLVDAVHLASGDAVITKHAMSTRSSRPCEVVNATARW